MQNLTKSLSTQLDKLQFRDLRAVMGYRQSTPLNVVLYESREPPLFMRNQYLCKKFLTRVLTSDGHPLRRILDSIQELVDSPITIDLNQPLLVESFSEVERIAHLLPRSVPPICFSDCYEALIYCPEVNLHEGLNITRGVLERSRNFLTSFRTNYVIQCVCLQTVHEATTFPFQDTLLHHRMALSLGNFERLTLFHFIVWRLWLFCRHFNLDSITNGPI